MLTTNAKPMRTTAISAAPPAAAPMIKGVLVPELSTALLVIEENTALVDLPTKRAKRIQTALLRAFMHALSAHHNTFR